MLMQWLEGIGRHDGRTAQAAAGRSRAFRAIVLAGAAALLLAPAAQADDRTKARRIHDRLAGVPPTKAVLDADEATGRQTTRSGRLSSRCHGSRPSTT